MDADEDLFDFDDDVSDGGDSDFEVDGIESGPSSLDERDGADDEFAYEVLSPEKIVQSMIDCIKQVNTVVELPSTQTRILLQYFNWDTEKLLERFYGSDQEVLFSEVHLISPTKKSVLSQIGLAGTSASKLQKRSSSSLSAQPSSSTKELLCEICYLPVPPESLTGLDCGHIFCVQCWSDYLTTKIMDEGVGQTISCAAYNCDILVDDGKVMELVKDAKVKWRYQHLITNSFVQCNKRIRWCPKPDCGCAVKVVYSDVKPVTCTCGFTFCFECGEMWHDPVKCYLLKKWQKKCDDDSETSNWIAANTKECPKCKATIEKDGGCNHMVCKNPSCKADFCWVCLGPWEPHGSSWYNCNRFNESEAKKARDAQEVSRSALQRYLFYCNRYMNHMQSLKFENKLYETTRQKMEEMQRHNMSWIEVQFLKKGVDILCMCRQTLMFTYVFAFYLSRNNQSLIFEDNQKDLENATEQLSEYLEREISADSVAEIKQKVQDKTKYCEHRCSVLLQHVHEGYDKDLWEYHPNV